MRARNEMPTKIVFVLDRNPVPILFFCLSKKIRKLQNNIGTGRGKDSSFGILEAMVYISKHCFVAQNYNFFVVSVTVLKI